MNFAQILSELAEQMAIAESILQEASDLGYFDDHPGDSHQVMDLKNTARNWLRAFKGGVNK